MMKKSMLILALLLALSACRNDVNRDLHDRHNQTLRMLTYRCQQHPFLVFILPGGHEIRVLIDDEIRRLQANQEGTFSDGLYYFYANGDYAEVGKKSQGIVQQCQLDKIAAKVFALKYSGSGIIAIY